MCSVRYPVQGGGWSLDLHGPPCGAQTRIADTPYRLMLLLASMGFTLFSFFFGWCFLSLCWLSALYMFVHDHRSARSSQGLGNWDLGAHWTGLWVSLEQTRLDCGRRESRQTHGGGSLTIITHPTAYFCPFSFLLHSYQRGRSRPKIMIFITSNE